MKTFITLIISIICLYVTAQSAFVAIGDTGIGSGGSLSVSVGEAVAGFSTNGQNSLSIGVQQSLGSTLDQSLECVNSTYGQSVSDITNNSALLTWNTIPNATLYRVRGTGLSETTINSGTQFNWSGLQAGTTYNWELRARISEGGSTYFSPWVACSFQTAGIVQKLALDNKDNWQISAFPNPFTDQFSLAIHDAIDGAHDLTIFDIAGKVVKRLRLQTNNELLYIGAALQPGHYVVMVVNPNKDRRFARIIKYE